MTNKSPQGLLAVKRQHDNKYTAPQEVLDKYLVKSSDAEIDVLVNDIFDPCKLWEKTPGVYASAMAAKVKPARGPKKST